MPLKPEVIRERLTVTNSAGLTEDFWDANPASKRRATLNLTSLGDEALELTLRPDFSAAA